MAARNLNLEIVKSLMKHNVDLNVEFNGNNALLISVEKNDKPFQTFLIENGAELDTFNSNGESALFMTAKSGNLDLARLLIKHGADVDILNSKKINALYLAVEIDNPEFAKLLVEAKASLDTVFYNGNTVLHLAVKYNRLEMTQVLAQAGAEVSKVNHKGRTPLMYALKFGHFECTKIILQYGGDANIMDYTERTALAFALENRERFYQNVNSFIQSIKAVLEFTKDVNWVYKLRGKKTTILLLSIKLEHFEVFKMILHAVSDIEETDDQGDTPLQAALQLPTDKRVDFVKILLSSGAQVNAANNLGQTPILTTVKNCDLDNTMLLVEAGANLNQRFPEHASGISGTVLHVAVKTKCVEMVKYLATLDFDINLQNQERKTALMLAAELGLSECVIALLKAKADVNIRDVKGCNALAYAINGRSPELNQSNTYLDCVKELLKYSSQVNVQYTIDVRQTTPLIDSIGFENVEYVKLILKAGSDLEMVDGRGRTALMVALRPQNKRRLEFAKYLIQFGANVNVVVKLGETPLGVSIRNRDYELAKLILQSGANVKDLKDNITCLHESSRQGNVEIVEIMIQLGVDVNSTDKLGQTAVMVAGNTECLSILIKAGCDVNKTDNKGRNAVMLASRDLKVGNLKVLITSGADVNARSHKGKTVLFYLIKTNNILRWEKFNKAVEILLNAKVNVDVTRESGDTILMVIAANYESFFKRSFGKFNHNFSQRLIEKSSDVNIQNHKLETVMHLCVKNNLLDLIYELIKKRFRIDMKDADGNTPLVFGVRKFEMTKALLDAGANPNIVNGSGKTPLMLAAEDDDVDETVVNLLVEHKANLNLPDSKGNTSLMLAVERCNVNKIQILLDAGAEVIHRKGFGAHAWAVCLARNYNSQQLNLMLKAGADMTGVNEQGETGLMLAVKHSRTEAIQFFMGAGDLDKQDNRGRSALMYTRDVSIQKILLEAGASINLQDYKGKSCFMKMVEKGDTNIETYAELYISYGLNMNIKDYTNRTALFYAFRAKSPLFMTNVMFLLKNNISPVIKINSSEFKTIVYDKIISETFSTAIFSNKIEILRFIICNGFFILFNGSSLLCQALNIDNTDIIKYCLANCYLNLEDLKLLKEKEESIPSSIKPALSVPWPLVKLALITVSSHMGYGAERIERVKRSELPIDLQDALLFNTPVARLPTSQWSSIPLNFDPKLYDDLETPWP